MHPYERAPKRNISVIIIEEERNISSKRNNTRNSKIGSSNTIFKRNMSSYVRSQSDFDEVSEDRSSAQSAVLGARGT